MATHLQHSHPTTHPTIFSRASKLAQITRANPEVWPIVGVTTAVLSMCAYFSVNAARRSDVVWNHTSHPYPWLDVETDQVTFEGLAKGKQDPTRR